MKKEITKQERLQIYGIITLGCIAAKQMKNCDDALNEILEAEDGFDTGALNEEYFEEYHQIDKRLKQMGITIKN